MDVLCMYRYECTYIHVYSHFLRTTVVPEFLSVPSEEEDAPLPGRIALFSRQEMVQAFIPGSERQTKEVQKFQASLGDTEESCFKTENKTKESFFTRSWNQGTKSTLSLGPHAVLPESYP